MTAGASSQRSAIVSTGILLVLATAIISGVSTFVNFWAVQGTNSDAFLATRNAIVALMLLPLAFLAVRQTRTRFTRAQLGRLGLIGLLGGAIPFLLFFRGLQLAGSSGAATATFGYRTLFLMATVLAIVVLRERVSVRMALAATLLLAGNALLLSLTAPIWTDGTAYVLLATGLWAAEYTVSKSTLKDVPSGTVALGRMGFGGVFLLGYLALSNQLGAVSAFSGEQWRWIALSAVLLFGFVSTWYAGLKTVDLSVGAAALVLAFPITWTLGLLVGQGSFDLAQAAGAVAVVAGVVAAIGIGTLRDVRRLVVMGLRTAVGKLAP